MATPLSALSTTDDLVACFEGLGGAYAAYSEELRANGVNGALVADYVKAGNTMESLTQSKVVSQSMTDKCDMGSKAGK